MIIVITGVIPTGPHHLTRGAETDAEERKKKERRGDKWLVATVAGQMASRCLCWREREGEMRRIATADLITRGEETKRE